MDEPPQTVGQAVEDGLRRMKVVWQAQTWEPELIAEYRRVLRNMGDARTVEAVVAQVVDSTEERFPPPPGVLVRLAREHANAHDNPRSGRPTFVEAAPDPRDPPGTVRYVVIQPDGRRVPAGASTVDDLVGA